MSHIEGAQVARKHCSFKCGSTSGNVSHTVGHKLCGRVMGIWPRGNTKVILFIFIFSKLNVYISCHNYILVLNMIFGAKPNYTCGVR
jgi:hypothetical protein